MSSMHTSVRSIDHLVLPVSDIGQARQRYEALGFTVAPDGRHPFGTENCCIFLADGTFLEPLGIAQRETCEEKARKGNSFVRNDQTLRFRRGDEGFSHLVLKSDDAKEDDRLYRSAGLSGGRMVRFSRAFTTPSGDKERISFQLAFAADPRSPDSPVFSCEVVNAPAVDRSALQKHDNGVIGLTHVLLSEANPTDFQYMFQTLLNQREMDVNSFGMHFEAANGSVHVLSPEGLAALYGIECPRVERGMRYEGFVLRVRSLADVQKLLLDRKITMFRHRDHLVVPPARGQGTTLILEEVV